MAVTQTTRLHLAKQATGDANWGDETNTGFDDADDRIMRTNAGDPNGTLTPHFIGQYCVDTTNQWMWIAKAGGINDWVRTYRLLQGLAANILVSDAATYERMLAYGTDNNALYYSDGTAWHKVGGRPTTPEVYDFLATEFEQYAKAAAGSWHDIEYSNGVTLQVDLVIPATPSYADWEIFVEGVVNMYDSGANMPGARLVQVISGGGGTTYNALEGEAAVCSQKQAPENLSLSRRVTSVTLNKTYSYHMEWGVPAAGNPNSVWVNYRAGGQGGPAGNISPKTFLRATARRMDQ
jgi:hypothetical protein